MSRFQGHICFVSNQPLPNILPTLHTELKPEKMYLLCGEGQKKEGEAQKKALESLGIKKVELIDISNTFNVDAIRRTIDREIIKFSADPWKELALNVTSGTNLMSFATLKKCADIGIDVFHMPTPYMPIPEVIWLKNTSHKLENLPIEGSLEIKTFLKAYGFYLENYKGFEKEKLILEDRRKLAKRWADRAGWARAGWARAGRGWDDAYKQLHQRQRVHGASENIVQVETPDQKGKEKLCTLLTELMRCKLLGLVKEKGDKYVSKFKDDESREWADGVWLEEYVYSELLSLREEYPQQITAVVRNVEVQTHRHRNIRDVIAIVNNQLWGFSCYMSAIKDIKIQLSAQNLARNMKDMGGQNARGCLVSFGQVGSGRKELIESDNISVIDSIHLHRNSLRRKLVSTLLGWREVRYRFAVLNPLDSQAASETNDKVFANPFVYGIKVRIAELADRCFKKLDPQYLGGNANRAAIEDAVTVEFLPIQPEGLTFATVYTDLDSVGSMAIFSLRAEGEKFESAKERIAMVANADKFAHGNYPGPKPPPTSMRERWGKGTVAANSSRWLAAIEGAVMDTKVPLDDRVLTMRRWLLTGDEPEYYRKKVERKRHDMVKDLDEKNIKYKTRSDGRIAVVERYHTERYRTYQSPYTLATIIGYCLAPVVVALSSVEKMDELEKKIMICICTFEEKFVDIGKALEELNKLETGWGWGWGGFPTLGSSPHDGSSKLTIDEVVTVVEKHLRPENFTDS